eukprot:61446-Rhodomonas_salina.1
MPRRWTSENTLEVARPPLTSYPMPGISYAMPCAMSGTQLRNAPKTGRYPSTLCPMTCPARTYRMLHMLLRGARY